MIFMKKNHKITKPSPDGRKLGVTTYKVRMFETKNIVPQWCGLSRITGGLFGYLFVPSLLRVTHHARLFM